MIEKFVTNPKRKRSFYNGEKPPWEYPTFIECYEEAEEEAVPGTAMEGDSNERSDNS